MEWSILQALSGRGKAFLGVLGAVLLALGAVAIGWRGSGGPTEPRRSVEAAPSPGVSAPSAYHRPGPGVNLLALEASPYLQLHARNPVDWYPWGEEAFARAKAEDKPVFLSIGYSTCYWCHVMEREVFSNAEIAALMNEHFISIKVDREERPDIDQVYMAATQILTGSGGWPNSLFLTPDGKPFYAGTYFPPEDRGGRPGFPRVLRGLGSAWSEDRPKLLATAEQVADRMERGLASGAGSQPGAAPPRNPLGGSALGEAVMQLGRSFDPEQGGFGRGAKFPRPAALELLLVAAERQRGGVAESMLTRTLDAMALGGIYDQLGGGFHRYATEPTWSIPHFEKMLYDNAQLVGLYARAYAVFGRPLYRRVAEQTIGYLEREMRHPEGGFFSAQDAEVDGDEGASYLWTRAEIEAVLGAERADAFLGVYELAPMPGGAGRGVLRVRPALAAEGAADLERFDADRAKLLERRSRRPQPLRDDKVLAAWNGLAIRALVQAANALGEPRFLALAEQAARSVVGRMLAEDGSLARSYVAGQRRERGVLDDYALLADGLLALHGATGDERWLRQAEGLADTLLARFSDEADGGFFLTSADTGLLVRPKSFEDGEIPSGSGVALRVLLTLSARTKQGRYGEAAARSAAAAAPMLREAPQALSETVIALVERGRAGAEQTAAASAPRPPASRLPRSEDHVRVSIAPGSARSELVVRLALDGGWHVNANPASLPYLIPTSVEVPTSPAVPGEVHYPEGRPFHPAFARDALLVYEGTVEIPVVLGRSEAPASLAVRFQACDLTLCLPPARVEIPVERAQRAPQPAADRQP
jgi:uncharacterized protein